MGYKEFQDMRILLGVVLFNSKILKVSSQNEII